MHREGVLPATPLSVEVSPKPSNTAGNDCKERELVRWSSGKSPPRHASRVSRISQPVDRESRHYTVASRRSTVRNTWLPSSSKARVSPLFVCDLTSLFHLGFPSVLRGFGLPVSNSGFCDCSAEPGFKPRQDRRSDRDTSELDFRA